ncbi:mechanosensitive ion channel family protein [Geomonas oryzae]|uniref:mechanosensitive ion channel family protein n=1 Tax=Geomonas oryzae TaxID=2364273 RepID=UPI001FEB55C5|nr:mechanosensitive ion channel family protein [Geomonas oryzae]
MTATRILITLLMVLSAASSFGAPPKASPAPVQHQPSVQPSPVIFDGRTLFLIRDKVLSYSPSDRAKAVSFKLGKLAQDISLPAEAVVTSDTETTTDILAGDTIIMSVTDRDAAAEGKTRQETARQFAAAMRGAIAAHRESYGPNGILLSSLYAALATAVLVFLLVSFRRAFPRLYQKIQSLHGTKIRSLRFQSFEIVNADRIVSMLTSVARGGRIIATVLLFYIYVPLVFSFFPWTRGYAETLFRYISEPVLAVLRAVGDYLPNLFFIVVISAVTLFVIRFTRLFFAEIGKGTISLPGFFPEWADPTFKIVRFLIFVFSVIVAFPYLPGSDAPAFKGVSIFFGVLLSLGSTSAVANIVAGVILTYMRAFKLGDRVKIADTVGDVTEKTLLVTRVRTIKNVDITIPNSLVLGSHITNFSSSAAEYGLILNTSVTIGYDVPWRQVHMLLKDAAKRTEHILELPAPFVLQTALNDFYVNYELNAYTDHPHQMATLYSDLHQNIQDAFNEAQVEIMSPHYTQVRDGNSSTIPESYLPDDYAPSSIRIFSTREKAPTRE